jgi:hypothetical protein
VVLSKSQEVDICVCSPVALYFNCHKNARSQGQNRSNQTSQMFQRKAWKVTVWAVVDAPARQHMLYAGPAYLGQPDGPTQQEVPQIGSVSRDDPFSCARVESKDQPSDRCNPSSSTVCRPGGGGGSHRADGPTASQ